MQKRMMLSAMMCLLLLGTAHANIGWNDCCNACHFQSDLDLDVGYRWDKLSNAIIFFADNPNSTAISQYKGSRIQSVQVGLSGIWAPCCTDGYLRARGHYSKVLGHGRYDEFSIVFGHVKGHMWDFNGALGYFVDMNCGWGFAPVVGYAYDKMDLTAHDVSAFLVSETNFGNIRYDQKFQGPFIGLDFHFCLSRCMQLKCGYELHWAKWKGQRIIGDAYVNQPGVQTALGFSTTRKHRQLWGNLFRVEGTYAFSRCWNLGLELQYQCFQSTQTGKVKSVGIPITPSFREYRVVNAYWYSFSTLLKLGYNF